MKNRSIWHRAGRHSQPFNENRRRHRHDGTHPGPPPEGNYMDLRAEMNLLVALSACPDLAVGGKPVDVMIYQT